MVKNLILIIIFCSISGCGSSNQYVNTSQYSYKQNFSLEPGYGPIELPKNCVESFNEYINLARSSELTSYSFAFAVSSDEEQCRWSGSPYGMDEAVKTAVRECSAVAISKNQAPCMLFAKSDKIVWKWDGMKDYLKGGRGNINFNEVNVLSGTGPITLSDDVSYFVDEYFNDYNLISYDSGAFAVSPDGEKYAMLYGSRDLIEIIKKQVTAACMTRNNGEQCYLYAVNQNVVWNF